MGQGYRNQWLHVLIGASGAVLGVALTFVRALPRFVPIVAALIPGVVVFWIIEYQLQWPISEGSDHWLDFIFHALGWMLAMIVTGLVGWLIYRRR